MLVLTFQIGDDRLGLDVRQVHEVVPRVELQRPAAGPPWLAGLFVYRGRVVPVIDLHQLLGAGACPAHLSSRIILVPAPRAGGAPPGPAGLLGLLAAHVADLRDVPAPGPGAPAAPGLGAAVVDGDGILHLVDLPRLLPDPALLPASPLVPHASRP